MDNYTCYYSTFQDANWANKTSNWANKTSNWPNETPNGANKFYAKIGYRS